MLHLTNGDAAASPLRRAGLPGHVIVWADVLHEGPVPRGDDVAAYREVRARYLAGNGHGSYDDILRRFAEWDAALRPFREHDELVLWFEHDLFDQLLIARHLRWLEHQPPFRTTISLVCIDGYPGVSPFVGLAQLTPRQLASLWPSRVRVSPEHLRAGAEVWHALTAPEPRRLAQLAQRPIHQLPLMQGALVRLLEELPWVSDGLSLTQRAVLETLTGGPLQAGEIFRRVQAREARVFMGDSTFWSILRAMATGDRPLIDQKPCDDDGPGHAMTDMTAAGRSVLDRRDDAVSVRGVDRWIGGVHLLGRGPVWRWDPASATVRFM
jgi:hypothetical protein